VALDKETTRLGGEILKFLLDSKEQEPIFQLFDKDKMSKAFGLGFHDSNAGSSFLHPLTACINLYSLNFWLKKYQVNVVKN